MGSKKGNILVVMLAGFLLLAIGVAGYLLWQNQQLQKSPNSQYPPNSNINNNQTTFPNTQNTNPQPTVQMSKDRNKLFLVNQTSNQEKTIYQATLFDPINKSTIKTKEIDLSVIPYPLTPIDSRFHAAYTSEPFLYTNDGKILGALTLFVNRMTGDVPDKNNVPFTSAIYKFGFDNSQPEQIYKTDKSIYAVAYSPESNKVAFTAATGGILGSTEVWSLDLKTRAAKMVTELNPTQSEDQTLSEIKFNPNNSQEVILLGRYAPKGNWIGSRLELIKINLATGKVDRSRILKEDGIDFGSGNLSPDNSKIMIGYTENQKYGKRIVKTLSNGGVVNLQDANNSNAYWSQDSSKLLYSTPNGWMIYDFNSGKSSSLPAGFVPIAWEGQNKSIAGIVNNKIVTYDLANGQTVDTGDSIKNGSYEIESAQWVN